MLHRKILLNTDIHVTGLIDNPGPRNRNIKLNTRVTKGRIEDLLRLIVDTPTRILSGEVALEAAVAIPPGPRSKRERLHVTGRFELAAAHFDQPQIQAKVVKLSRRGQGKNPDDRLEPTLSRVVGGWKSVFVKPLDFAFKRPGAGTVIPIAVSGTRSSPQLQIRFGAMIKRAAGGSASGK